VPAAPDPFVSALGYVSLRQKERRNEANGSSAGTFSRRPSPTAAVDRRFWANNSKNSLAGWELLSYDSNERMNQLFMEVANNHG
jgi:hypothetical protein